MGEKVIEINPTKSENEWNNRKVADFDSKFLLQTVVASIVLDLIAFTMLGIAFGLIVQGALLILFRLSFFWEPARRFFLKIILLKNAPPFIRRPLLWWGYITQGFGVIVQLAAVGVGFYLLFRGGFLNQNLIYLLFFKK